MPAMGSEARFARKPYSKPTCTHFLSSDLTTRFQISQKVRRSLGQRASPIVAVESYSGPLRSLVNAVDSAFHSSPPPVIILLNPQEPHHSEAASDPGLNVWRMSGNPEARDIAAVLATFSAIQHEIQPTPAPFVLRGGTHE